MILINILNITLIVLIFLRSSDEIQFRRQMSPLSNVIGNSTPNTLKERYDQFIFLLVLILLGLQIYFQIN